MSDSREQAKSGRANAIVVLAIAIVVVAAIVVFALQSGAAPTAESANASGRALVALVHDADGNTRELPLSTDSETTVTTSLGTNVVVVEDGAVYVRGADCDNHDCVNQGRIDRPGRQIICLPHELWIEVVAPGDAPGALNVNAAASADTSGKDDLDAVAR